MEVMNDTPCSSRHTAVKRRTPNSDSASPTERYTKRLWLTFSTTTEKQAFEDKFATVKLMFGHIANQNTDTLMQALQFVLDHQQCKLQGIAASTIAYSLLSSNESYNEEAALEPPTYVIDSHSVNINENDSS